MYVSIEQRKWGFSSKYDIHTSNDTYYAEKKLFSLTDRLRLFDSKKHLMARLKSHFFIFRPRYDFELFNSKVYRFSCEKFWKGVFLCEGDSEVYRLYRHQGREYSIFRGEVQIAAFSKEKISIGKGDVYHVRMDDDANFILILCLALTMDSIESADSDNDGHTVTIDLGNIGPEYRPFDRNWEPNESAQITPDGSPGF